MQETINETALIEKIKDRLKKVNELVKRGEAGEAAAAKNLLEKQLKQYGLTIDDIESEELERNWFTYKTNGKADEYLFNAIADMLEIDTGSSQYDRKNHYRAILATKVEQADFKMHLDFYRDAWREFLEEAIIGFQVVNRLYKPETEEEKERRRNRPQREETPEERAKQKRIKAQMDGMNSKIFRKRLE